LSKELVIVVEDKAHSSVIERVVRDYSPGYSIGTIHGNRGSKYIKKNLKAFNNASKFSKYIVLTDLDNKDCPVELKRDWFTFTQNKNLLFRVAVREVETWLLADRTNFARYLGVTADRIQIDVEGISDPKQFIINLAKRSRLKKIKQDIVPVGSAKVGPNYNTSISKFIYDKWNIELAKAHSESLRRFVDRVKAL
jgi:hypothetical protein